MPRQILPIYPTQLSNIKPKEKEFNVSDGHGLMLRVKPTGSKVWIFNYYHPISKKRKNLTIGTYPQTSLAKARKQREYYRALLQEGLDPKENEDNKKKIALAADSNSFESVAKEWLAIRRSQVKQDTADKILRSLELDVFPFIGKVAVSKITAPIAIDVIKRIISRDSLEIARKVARRMNNVMTFAVNTGLAHHNPLTGIKEVIPSSKAVNQPTIPPEELPEFMKNLNFAKIKLTTRCLIEWQLHTMVRPGEAAQAKWSEVDEKELLWKIPASKMKMGKEHQIPLSKQAISILRVMKQYSSHREYIFPSLKNPKSHANPESANMAIKRMGYEGKLVAHGLRALASTTLNESGFEPDVIESALAHVDRNSIRAAYNRAKYLDKRRDMMNWWSNHIELCSQGSFSLGKL